MEITRTATILMGITPPHIRHGRDLITGLLSSVGHTIARGSRHTESRRMGNPRMESLLTRNLLTDLLTVPLRALDLPMMDPLMTGHPVSGLLSAGLPSSRNWTSTRSVLLSSTLHRLKKTKRFLKVLYTFTVPRSRFCSSESSLLSSRLSSSPYTRVAALDESA